MTNSVGKSPSPLARVAVIIPALNEADNLARLVPELRAMGVGQVIVGDNGSTDGSGAVAGAAGATVAPAPKRGYGEACQAALTAVDADATIIAFLDADFADDHHRLDELVGPIADDACDLVIGARVKRLRKPGSMTAPQVFGNWLATRLIRWGWGYRYRDLGPFRAIRRSSLERIAMRDRAFGWTVEMQIRAVEEGLRIRELPVAYAKRRGRSKISGTVKGVVLAGYWILGTCGKLWWTKSGRK
jgi:glycosyltransferase involved in cell wall biosynthesis